MQDRYVGDIGDFVKLALLRALQPSCRLGVAWWLFPDEDHNKDGRHVGYLAAPDIWRPLDAGLFDALGGIVARGERQVAALEVSGILNDTVFFREAVPTAGPSPVRRLARRAWFARLLANVEGCDLVFVDPDNGLETASFSEGALSAGKSVSISELTQLARPGRVLIVYHHHTRRKGGHAGEIGYWAERLQDAGFETVDAVRSWRYSPRSFFILNASPETRKRAQAMVSRWGGLLSFHPGRTSGEA